MTPRVLMVDDVPANLLALEAALEGLPCELVRARSGAEALKLLLQGEYAVVLLDVQMPEMDGYEVARRARGNDASRDVPIIFLTAMNQTEDNVLRGYGSGAVDLLFKPINPHVLRSKVQVFLDLYIGRQRLAQEIVAHKSTMKELEAFNYTVSHDLRAPLRSIDGFTRILAEDYAEKLDDEGKQHIARVRAAVGRMNALIEDLMALARVASSELHRSDVDVSRLAKEIVDRLAAAEPGRAVEVVIAPNLRAEADRGLCAVVLENLLGNAWKFTAKCESARIEVGGHETDGTYFIRDNGAGFDMAQAKRMFGVFQRLHSTKDFDGTGIGLATVRRIVERHGGRISADGEPGKGATFTFMFKAR
jgi:signal transduction histidine kinase